MDGLENDADRIQVLEYFSTLMKYVPEISSNIVQLIKVDLNYYTTFSSDLLRAQSRNNCCYYTEKAVNNYDYSHLNKSDTIISKSELLFQLVAPVIV